MATPECWSRSFGDRRGTRIRVFERSPGGMLYVSAWMPESGESRRSLGHRDRERAVQQARELLAVRATDTRLAETGSPLTLAVLFRRYTTEGRYLPDGSLKTDTYLRHIRLAGNYLERFFGAHQLVATLTPDRIRDYVVWRRGGGATGEAVGANTIQRDLGMFKAALNWACQKHDGGVPLLSRHPMERFKVPAEKDPKRPILDAATIRGLLDVAPQVHPFLRPIVLLAWRTGRRLSSILALRWEDVDFDAGTIVWRAETDKIRQTWVVPAHREVLLALAAFRAGHPGIGSAFVFPHPQRRRHRAGPVTRHLAAWWLKEAFRRGALTKPVGSLWHTFRRVWATERKDLPLKDVAAAGGWRDTSTLLRYQQPDAATMRSVVEFERQRDVAPVVRKLASNSLTYSLTPRR